jgi:hypothetical protein
MPIETEPKPRPSELDYVPPESVEHKVSGDESWWTLAERPEVKAAGMTANDLCYFNFKTRKPAEINWYLYHKVGCRKATRDGKNYMFSAADQPGRVYLPKIGAPLPVDEFAPNVGGDRLNAWFGLGGKVGTQFVVIGIETLTGYVVSLDDPGKGMVITGSINRVGPGFGASGGACFIYITGVSSPGELSGYQQGGGDFNLSLGGNWGKLAQTGAKYKKLKPLIDALTKLGAQTPSGLKQAIKADPDKAVELSKTAKSLKDSLEIDPNAEPNVFIFDVPFAGGGVEASAYYGLANFEAVADFTE